MRMVISYISDSMYKKVVSAALFLLLVSVNTPASVRDSLSVESVGVITANVVYVRKDPSLDSKKIYTFYEGGKIIITGEEGKWYKVKVNNVRSGYALKKDIKYNNSLQKEHKQSNYYYKKLSLGLRSLTEKFNNKLKDSSYYDEEGIVPVLDYGSLKTDKNKVVFKIVYTAAKKTEAIKNTDVSNIFSKEFRYFLEVIFFKLINSPYEQIEINIVSKKVDEKELTPYARLKLNKKELDFSDVKDEAGEIWKYVESNKNMAMLFSEYPI